MDEREYLLVSMAIQNKILRSIKQSYNQSSYFQKGLALLTVIGFIIALHGFVSWISNEQPTKQDVLSLNNSAEHRYQNTTSQIADLREECFVRNKNLSNELQVCRSAIPILSSSCRNRTEQMKYGFGFVIDDCNPPYFVPHFSGLNDQITLDLWFKLRNTTQDPRYLFDFGVDPEKDSRLSAFIENGVLKFRVKEPYEFGEGIITKRELNLISENEYSMTLMIDKNLISLFIYDQNGTEIFEETRNISSKINLSDKKFVLGADLRFNHAIYGSFDELRISSVLRSKDWINATHQQIYIVGEEQSIN